ncbi:hypothetical protein ECP03048163_5336 [Escherichia coli P0304816.3]|nr:hypothetical protein ECP030481615_4952 [Escherichia coli P0304816.15]ENH26656.1 hypothetical protein ECP03048163_5336 [Escherichia coli P0304816.3]
MYYTSVANGDSYDKGILLAEEMLAYLRQNKVMFPAIDVVERTCAEAMAGGDKISFRR